LGGFPQLSLSTPLCPALIPSSDQAAGENFFMLYFIIGICVAGVFLMSRRALYFGDL